MQYLIFVEQDDDHVAMCFDVPKADKAYLQKQVLPKMKPLADDEYLYGPAGIVRTPAKSSYVIDGKDVYWCIAWQPGLLVIRFSPDGSMKWAAMKSPKIDEDEDDENPQYNLVYHAWDAQFDEIMREDWKEAPDKLTDIHENAMAPVNKLHERLESGFKSEKDISAYFKRVEKSDIWNGKVSMG